MAIPSATLRACHAALNDCVTRLDAYIQTVTARAYQRPSLLGNQVLSRNPFGSRLLHNVLFGIPPRPIRAWQLVPRLARYYVGSAAGLVVYGMATIAVRALGRPPLGAIRGATTIRVVDSFVVIDRVLREGGHHDQNFVGLGDALRARGIPWVLVPKFYPAVRHPWAIRRVVRILRSADNPCLTEFDLLTASDWCRLCWTVLRYPFDVFALVRTLQRPDPLEQSCAEQLLATLGQVTFPAFARYLVGRRLGAWAPTDLRVLSWTENQVQDKSLYRGLRDSQASVTIIGCQAFLGYPVLINARVADADVAVRATPDVVLVNGPAFLRPTAAVPHRLGPSFRYGWLFRPRTPWTQKTDTVVFLNYSLVLNREMLDLCRQSPALAARPRAVRSHPSAGPRERPALPAGWHFSSASREHLIDSAAMVVTTESGTAVEAAARGASVLIVGNRHTFTANPMLPRGEGRLWKIAFDVEELDAAYQHLLDYRATHPQELQELADWYRDSCFVEPTSDAMARVFDDSGLSVESDA
jgi:hypothetical protein